jgi:thiosulfate/3-mercaptopyruvate sulfurtransferase
MKGITCMSYTTLISTATLAENLTNPNWVVVDCRFALDNPSRGQADYNLSHISGAVYAHLDHDLSSPVVKGVTGRHPLPNVAVLADKLGAWGIDETAQVVAYDDNVGGFAARLWWLLQWLGHENVAVLDGGWARWTREGRSTNSSVEARQPRMFTPRPRADMVADARNVLAALNQSGYRILDARAPERYRGDVEPIDPVAGHIAGALSAPYMENIENGVFLLPDALKQRYEAIFAGTAPDHVTCYCGSGVTAAHNILAIKHAGLGDVKLYPGSWSEWITDPSRPTAKGSN